MKIKGFDGTRNLFVRSLVNAHIDLLAEVVDVVFVAPIMVQEVHQSGFQRQYFPDKPNVHLGRICSCGRTAQVGILTVGFRSLGHSLQLPAFREFKLSHTPIKRSRPRKLRKADKKFVRQREEC